MKFLPLAWALLGLSAMLALHATSPSDSGSQGLLLVANKGDQSLGIVDPRAGQQIATVAEGGTTGH